jgi:hypothetical protein
MGGSSAICHPLFINVLLQFQWRGGRHRCLPVRSMTVGVSLSEGKDNRATYEIVKILKIALTPAGLSGRQAAPLCYRNRRVLFAGSSSRSALSAGAGQVVGVSLDDPRPIIDNTQMSPGPGAIERRVADPFAETFGRVPSVEDICDHAFVLKGRAAARAQRLSAARAASRFVAAVDKQKAAHPGRGRAPRKISVDRRASPKCGASCVSNRAGGRTATRQHGNAPTTTYDGSDTAGPSPKQRGMVS